MMTSSDLFSLVIHLLTVKHLTMIKMFGYFLYFTPVINCSSNHLPSSERTAELAVDLIDMNQFVSELEHSSFHDNVFWPFLTSTPGNQLLWKTIQQNNNYVKFATPCVSIWMKEEYSLLQFILHQHSTHGHRKKHKIALPVFIAQV